MLYNNKSGFSKYMLNLREINFVFFINYTANVQFPKNKKRKGSMLVIKTNIEEIWKKILLKNIKKC